jgi:hypothetical protein
MMYLKISYMRIFYELMVGGGGGGRGVVILYMLLLTYWECSLKLKYKQVNIPCILSCTLSISFLDSCLCSVVGGRFFGGVSGTPLPHLPTPLIHIKYAYS